MSILKEINDEFDKMSYYLRKIIQTTGSLTYRFEKLRENFDNIDSDNPNFVTREYIDKE